MININLRPEVRYMRAIGMSTGIFHRSISSVSREIFKIHQSLGCSAIEIGCIRKKRLLELVGLYAQDIRSRFDHLSLHAPTDLSYKDNEETRRILGLIAKAHERFRFDLVVFHPENITDWSAFENLPFRVGIENADWRKCFGKTVEDLEEVFKNTNFGFVLDVNHCFTNDRSMELARVLADRFSDRICEIHVSGFFRYHEPICITRQVEILKAIPVGNAPIIIESVCVGEEVARQELEYVGEYLRILQPEGQR